MASTSLSTPTTQLGSARNGWALALFSSLCFSIAPPIARAAIQAGIDSTTLVVLRLLIATALIGLTIAISAPARLRIDRRGFLITVLAGAVNGLGMLFFFWSLEHVTASLASMMLALCPLITLSLLALGGERFTYRHIVRLVLGLTGIYLLIGAGSSVSNDTVTGVGILLLLAADLCFSIQPVLLQWYLRGYDSRTITLYGLVGMTATVLTSWAIEGKAWQSIGVTGWLSALTLAFVGTFLARLSYVMAVGKLGGGQTSLLTPFETLFTLAWSFLFLNERLTLVQSIGGALILTSALLAIQRLGRVKGS